MDGTGSGYRIRTAQDTYASDENPVPGFLKPRPLLQDWGMGRGCEDQGGVVVYIWHRVRICLHWAGEKDKFGRFEQIIQHGGQSAKKILGRVPSAMPGTHAILLFCEFDLDVLVSNLHY